MATICCVGDRRHCNVEQWACQAKRMKVERRTLRAGPQGDWPRVPLLSAYSVVEKGGFVWLFNGSKALPMDARPPIPYVPELDDPQ